MSARRSIGVRRRVAQGPNVYLRTPRVEDWPEINRLMKASREIMRGFATPFENITAFAGYLKRCEGDDYAGFLICRTDDDAIAGMINVSQIVRGTFQNACIGYMIGQPFARRGYMSEALQLVLRLAFEELKLHRVEANIQPNNVPSIALVKRAGFRLEGFSPRFLKIAGKWCDHERWAILADEWQPRSLPSSENLSQPVSHAKPR